MGHRAWNRILVAGVILATAGCGGSRGGDAPAAPRESSGGGTAAAGEPFERAMAAVKAAESHLAKKDSTAASQQFTAATRALADVQEPDKKAEAAAQLAVALVQAGRKNEAQQHAQSAERLFAKIAEPERQIEIGSLVAVALGQSGSTSASDKLLQSLEATAAKGATLGEVVTRSAQVAGAYHRLRKTSQADRLFGQLVAKANACAEATEKTASLLDLADMQANLKHPAAEKTLAAAIAAAKTIPKPSAQAFKLCDAARLQWKLGQKEPARELLKQARQTADTDQDPDQSSEARHYVEEWLGKLR